MCIAVLCGWSAISGGCTCVCVYLHNVGCWCWLVYLYKQYVCIIYGRMCRCTVHVHRGSEGAILQLKALLCSSNFCPMNAVFVYTMLHKVE